MIKPIDQNPDAFFTQLSSAVNEFRLGQGVANVSPDMKLGVLHNSVTKP